jgi:hypothetical protein
VAGATPGSDNQFGDAQNDAEIGAESTVGLTCGPVRDTHVMVNTPVRSLLPVKSGLTALGT